MPFDLQLELRPERGRIDDGLKKARGLTLALQRLLDVAADHSRFRAYHIGASITLPDQRNEQLLPVIGAIACIYLVLPWTSGRPIAQYQIAGALLAIGIVLWAVTYVHRRVTGYDAPPLEQPERLL